MGMPVNIQKLADQCYELLKSNPRHPSPHFKKIGKYHSVRVGLHYRACSGYLFMRYSRVKLIHLVD